MQTRLSLGLCWRLCLCVVIVFYLFVLLATDLILLHFYSGILLRNFTKLIFSMLNFFYTLCLLSAGAAHQQELLPAQKCTGSIQRICESLCQPQGEASVWCGEAGSQSSGQVLWLLCATLRWPQYPFLLLFLLQKLVIFHGRLQVFMNIGNKKLGLKFSCKVKEQQAIRHACAL